MEKTSKSKLPFLLLNTIDINTIFSQLFTQSYLSTEVNSWNLNAFHDPMVFFYQTKCGLHISFGENFRECKCSKFPLSINCISLPAPIPYLYMFSRCMCGCIYGFPGVIEVLKVIIDGDNNHPRYSFRVVSIDVQTQEGVTLSGDEAKYPPMIYVNTFLLRQAIQDGYLRLLALGKFKLNEELLTKLEVLKSQLDSCHNTGTMLRLRDRLLFGNTFVVGKITRRSETETKKISKNKTITLDKTIYTLNGGIVVSLFADKDELRREE